MRRFLNTTRQLQTRSQALLKRTTNRRPFSTTISKANGEGAAPHSANGSRKSGQRPMSSTQAAPYLAREFTEEEEHVTEALRHLIHERQLDHSDGASLAVIYDMDMLEDLRLQLKHSLPQNWLHAFAIKAAPFDFFLCDMVQDGMGLEAASFLEVKMAEAAGCPSERIVFDSPAKTIPEIRYALENGLLLNCNSMDELARVRKAYDSVNVSPLSRIGVRINPLIGSGSVESLSVSKADSKFGIIDQEEVIEAFEQFPALCGLHVHTGSQGMTVEQLAQGVATVTTLAEKINRRCGGGRVTTIDIGGGLSTNYDSMEISPTFAEYAAALEGCCPEIFSLGEEVQVVTEFGRALCAKAAWVATGVEYVMRGDPEKPVAITHAGADLFVRPCYDPEHFKHRFSAFAGNGTPLSQCSKEERTYDIAGPLCFAGDVIGRSITLPTLNEGDWIVIHDCGANTFALWSRHCSRQAPPVFGVTRRSKFAEAGEYGVEVRVLKEKEKPEHVMEFWK